MRVKIDRSHPEPVNNQKDERTERQTTRPAADAGLPTNPGDPSNSRTQWVYLRYAKVESPVDGDGTPGMRRLDPRCTETGPQATRPQDPASRTRTRDFAESRTSWDSRLRGIQDYAGLGTSWDSRLRRTLDFVGSRTSQKTGTLHTPDQDLVLWCSLREHKTFRIKLKTWTPLGIRLVVSVKYCVLFLWLLGARTLPTELYRAR